MDGNSSDYHLKIQGTDTSNNSFGAIIDAGTSSSDYALRVRSQAGAAELLSVRGDGYVTTGSRLIVGENLYWTTDNTYNIGANGANRPANVYVGTAYYFPDGTSQTSAASVTSFSSTVAVTGTYSNSTWATCLATVTINSGSNKLKVSFNGSVYNASGNNSNVTIMGFLLDGAFFGGQSSSVGVSAQAVVNGVTGNLSGSIMSASQSSGIHRACVWFWTDAGGTHNIYDASHQLSSKNVANELRIEEVK
jgi:hypothetical protein